MDKSSQSDFWNHLHDSLRERRAQNLLREISLTQASSPTRIKRHGVEVIQFGSNDYLGLSWHPAILDALQKQSRYGSGASPAVTGFQSSHQRMHESLCAFEQAESAIVFSSGYAANVGTVSALANKEDILFSDSLNHASLIDGCRLSRARVIVFPHGDMESLQRLIHSHRKEGRFGFIVSDSVFSMDGDLAPVHAIQSLCEEFDLQCILDEAHATGVYGSRGQGLLEREGIQSNRFVRIGTLSKAVGCVGGFVSGPKLLTDWLTNYARSWLYSTATPIANARAVSIALPLVANMRQERTMLAENSLRIRSELRALGMRVGEGDSPIIPVYMSSPNETIAASKSLLSNGVFVPAIRPPTVPPGGCLLRISLSVSHSSDELRRLTNAFRSL